jgi:hypothetical protein
MAGRRAAQGRGRRSLVASDLPPELPGILENLGSGGRSDGSPMGHDTRN